jgi:hypothetical protein
MLKWSVNNIPEMVKKEVNGGVGVVWGEGQGLDRRGDKLHRRGNEANWKKVKCVMKFCKIGSNKQVRFVT